MKKQKNAFVQILFIAAITALLLTLPFYALGCQNRQQADPAPASRAEEAQTSTSADAQPVDVLDMEAVKGQEKEEKILPVDGDKPEDTMMGRQELLEYKPNELGSVMVLMYHQIGTPEGEWVRTPHHFRKDLLTLYEGGYRLLNLLDYVRGEIDIEAGMSPVVLTFDDGSSGQFYYHDTEEGRILDPDCAIAILEDFCEKYPDFGKGATFYIYYPNPFRQKELIEKKFDFLASNGYEIGNHTYSHADLSKLSAEEAAMEIALHAKKTEEILMDYEVRSISLPYGIYPKDRQLLLSGSEWEQPYANEAVLLVGSNPAPSPFSMAFDPLGIPRIRASEIMVENMGLYDWLSAFEKNPLLRYVSDGNVHTVTAPQEYSQKIDQERARGRQVYFY